MGTPRGVPHSAPARVVATPRLAGGGMTRTRAMRRRLLATRLVFCGEVGRHNRRVECPAAQADPTEQASDAQGTAHRHGSAPAGCWTRLPGEVGDEKEHQRDVQVQPLQRGQQQRQRATRPAICRPGPHGRGVLWRVHTRVTAGRHSVLATVAASTPATRRTRRLARCVPTASVCPQVACR